MLFKFDTLNISISLKNTSIFFINCIVMARTKADAYTKAAVKAPRKQSVLKGESASSAKSGLGKDRHSGGNPYCLRPTPAWQKPITSFFSKNDGKDEPAEEKPMQDASATSSCEVAEECVVVDESVPTGSKGDSKASATSSSVGFDESAPSCSKGGAELMEFMDSEAMSKDEECHEDDSAMNLESDPNDDSKLGENAMVTNGGGSKLEEDAKNLDPVVNGGDSELQVDAKNSESGPKEDSKLEGDDMNLDPMPKDDIKLEGDVKNLDPVANESAANFMPCGSKEEMKNDQDPEAIPREEDDGGANLPENSGINAATIGVHASPAVNDLDPHSFF